jgi:hypothetical protein
MSNVLFINGWGGAITSTSLAGLRNRTIAEFGEAIYAPPPVNYEETGLILRYLEKWKDVQILVGLSCGCSTINAIAKHAASGERIPFAMYFSPSIWCGVGDVSPIVERAAEVHSRATDPFNPGSRRLIVPADGNLTTKFDGPIKSGLHHGFTPDSQEAQQVLFEAIRQTLD